MRSHSELVLGLLIGAELSPEERFALAVLILQLVRRVREMEGR